MTMANTIKSPKKLIEVALPLEDIECGCISGEVHPPWASVHVASLEDVPEVGCRPEKDFQCVE